MGDENNMEYKGYELIEDKDRVIIEGVGNFNPVHVFECGQCFRWIKQKDGSYNGTAKGRAINVSFNSDKLIISNTTIEDFINIWFEYFDLGRDYSSIKEKLKKDEIMRKAVDFGYGIRLLKQDIWETLISFIISANNRIPMIMRTVDTLSRTFGTAVHLDDKDYYTFPGTDILADASMERVQESRCGFRCKYIIQASQMVRNGDVSLGRLAQLDAGSAREELKKLPGVGGKVADCTLLYSGTKYEVFPTDVWVKRVMGALYFKREASHAEIQEFAKQYFGELAGFAQQYLFYYARENKIR